MNYIELCLELLMNDSELRSELLLCLFVIIFCVFCLIKINSITAKQKEIRNKKGKEYESKYNISKEAQVIKYFSGIDKMDKDIKLCNSSQSFVSEHQKYFFWINEGDLNIISKPKESLNKEKQVDFFVWTTARLDTEKINYYTIQGDKYATTKIQGGGSSLGKAVVGGAIAGGAGAVVASRKGITSTTEVVDDRKTMIYYEDDNGKSIIVLSSEAYDYLLRVLPEKEYSFVLSQQKEPESKQSSSLAELEQLAQLRDKGILTEEEFIAKKKKILGL